MPIQVVSATEDHSIRSHQYHVTDQGRVRYRKVCELEDREASQEEIGKGYEPTNAQATEPPAHPPCLALSIT